MGSILRVTAHPAGHWLVKVGCIQYAVPPGIGRALRCFDGKRPTGSEMKECLDGEWSAAEIDPWVRELDQALNDCAPPRPTRVIRFRVPLLPATLVQVLTGGLRPLTGNRGLACLALTGAAGYLAALAGAGPIGFSPDLGNVITGLGLLLLSAVWHELGHAAALARSGYPAGGIGAGILFVVPVLYADVTAVGILPRAGRLRVDVAGVIFQMAAGGVLMALAVRSGCGPFWSTALFIAGSSVLLACTWSLFPFIRSDGYWLLCDLLGLDDLDRPPRGPLRIPLRVFLILYQLANAGFLLLLGIYFPWRVIRLGLGLAHRAGLDLESTAVHWATAGLVLVFILAMGIGLVRRIGSLLRAAWVGLVCLKNSR